MADTPRIIGQLNLQLPAAPKVQEMSVFKEFTDVYNGIGNLADHAVSNKSMVPFSGGTPVLGDPVDLYNAAGVLTARLATPVATGVDGFVSAIVDLTVEVSYRGLNPFLSGLTPGAKYYVDPTGVYTTVVNGSAVGKAMDTETLFFYGISQ
jgi:hypothetical protein